MNMKNLKLPKLKKKYFAVLIAIAAVVVLMGISMGLYFSSSAAPETSEGGAIAVVALLILVPILLGGLLAVLYLNRKEEPEPLQIVAETVEQTKTEVKKTNRRRFDGLCRIDEEKTRYAGGEFNGRIGLKEFCETFRDYAAGKLRL